MKRIRKVAVLGSGTMGARIAAHLANAGVPSFLLDIIPAAADAGSRIKIALAGLDGARKTKPAAFFEPSLSSLVTPGNFEDDLTRVAEADWIIEAVVEDLEIKRKLFERVEAVLGGLPGSAEPNDIIRALYDDVQHFVRGAHASDDLTLLCLRWRGIELSGR